MCVCGERDVRDVRERCERETGEMCVCGEIDVRDERERCERERCERCVYVTRI